MFNWDFLNKVLNKYIASALLVLSILPRIYHYLKNIRIESSEIRLIVLGAVIFVITAIISKLFTPENIKEYESLAKFQERCKEIPVAEFVSLINTCNNIKRVENEIIKEGKEHLTPLSKGLKYNKEETLNLYSKRLYINENKSKIVIRILIVIFIAISLVLLNWKTIKYLKEVF